MTNISKQSPWLKQIHMSHGPMRQSLSIGPPVHFRITSTYSQLSRVRSELGHDSSICKIYVIGVDTMSQKG
jgi:hypothetical protein